MTELLRFRQQWPATGPGMVVGPELRALSERSGFLTLEEGGQRMRDLYVDGSAAFEPSLLSDFGLACFMGFYDEVKRMVDAGIAPDICGHETQYRHGYLTLVVSGRQRIQGANAWMRHTDVARYLIHHGAPTELDDIAGYTALQHATIRDAVPDVARILLEGGANPNHQNKYGCTALMDSCLTASVESINLLLEFGGDPDIPDADGCKPSVFCIQAGPQVAAVFAKWARKRAGEKAAARTEKQCDSCGKPPAPNKTLHVCARCKIARYCDAKCQRAHWPTHKSDCKKFNEAPALVMKPHYPNGVMSIMSGASLVRSSAGLPDPFESRGNNGTRWGAPRELPKPLIIKVQIPPADFGSSQNMGCLVYTKKRDLMCTLRPEDNSKTYDILVQAVKKHGAAGLKAYFAAEMKKKNELIIKVHEALAVQPF